MSDNPAASFMAQPPEPVMDSLGRRIGLRKMTGGARARAVRAAGRDANEIYISMAVIAAACAAIDGKPIPFPMNPQQIENVLDMLGDEGMEAVGGALGAQNQSREDLADAAKNS